MTPATKRIILESAISSPLVVPNCAAWYDTADLSSMLVDSANRVSLLMDKSGRSAVNCLVLDGVTGNYASVPDAAPIRVIGDIGISARFAAVNWTVASAQIMVSRYQAANRSYRLEIEATTGKLQFRYSTDGTDEVASTSSVAVGGTAFLPTFVGATRNATTGDVKFWTSVDGTAWIQLGTTQATTPGAINAGTSTLLIGANQALTSFANGRFYRATVRSGTDLASSPIVFDANFGLAAKLATSFTESSANAATVTINTSGATGARICGERDLYQGTVANQPVLLRWLGENCGYQRGAAGDYFSTPSSVALNFTGNFVLIYEGTQTDWTPSAIVALVGKYGNTANKRQYQLILNTDGTLALNVSADGAVGVQWVSTAAPAVSDFGRIALRVDYVAATGTATFYTAPTIDGTWVQLGAAVVGAATTPFTSDTVLEVGSSNVGASVPGSGRTYRSKVISGTFAGGTLVADFNPALYVSGPTFVAATGETWTVNGGATIATRTGLYFDGSNDYLKAAAFSLVQPETVYFVGQQVAWTSGDYLWDGHAIDGMGAFQFTGTPKINIYAGSSAGDNSDWTLRTMAVLRAVYQGATSSLSVNRGAAVVGNAGAANANGFTVGSYGAGTNQYGNIVDSEIAIYSVAHPEQTQNRIAEYFRRRWRLVF